MQYRWLGRSGVRVSTICLGSVFLGSLVSADDSARIVHAALDHGVNFIDTAEIYQRPQYGIAEETVGKALVGRRHEVVLATKKRYDPGAFRTGKPSDHNLSRHHIIRAVDESLRRLQTDYIDLYYPHHVDPNTALDETLRALDDVVRAGKVRSIGLSNYASWQLVEALWIAQREHLAPVVCVQTLYNLLDRDVERELIPACRRHDISIVPYSPLAGGVLTGKYRPGQPPPPDSRAATFAHNTTTGRSGHVPLLSDRNLVAAERLTAVAPTVGLNPGHASLAWLLHQPTIASVIVGPSNVNQIIDNCAAADLVITPEQAKSIANAIEGVGA